MALTEELLASLKLIENKEYKPPEPEPKQDNVVDLAKERLVRQADEMSSAQITVTELLMLIQADIESGELKPCKCYVTFISDDGADCMDVANYRANMSRVEEIAYRQLGVMEAVERWKG